MKKILLHGLCLVSVAASAFSSFDLFVDSKASPGGDGSEGAPFQTISDALKAVPSDGATITVKGGVYREMVNVTKGGTPDSPVIVKAAAGEQVVVTGFEPLAGWKDEGAGLYSLETTERVGDLFVDARRQRVARFPDADYPWIRVMADDPAAGQLELENAPEVPGNARADVYALIYCGAINGEVTYPVTAFDSAAKKVTVSSGGRPFLPKSGDALVFLNASSFVSEPGEWSCQPSGNGWRVLFRPERPEDLQATQTRRRPQAIRVGGEAASHVVLEGLEITGGITYGVYASGVSGLKISRCIIYANGTTGDVAGLGLRIDRCRDFTMDSCIVFGNHVNGVGITQGENIVVRGCEITANDGDGIVFAGRGNLPDDPLRNVRLENCYVHRHFYLGHPDNTQIHSNVRNVTYENNVLFMAGQNAMIQACEDMKFINNVFFGATARHVILGHGTSHHAAFRNNTFAFANYGSIGTAARGVSIEDNVFYQNVLSYESEDVKGDRNLFWARREDDPILIHTVPRWKKYTTPQEFAVDHESEVNSRREDPQFKNVPLLQVVGRSTFFEGARNLVYLEPKSVSEFAVGDTIEINGDGVARQVEAVGGDSITFTPELPTLPFRNAFVWKWPKDASLKIDLTAPQAGRAGQPGATVDFAAYQRGALDGSGKRSLPELSAMARAAMPSPDVFIYPFCLPVGK